MQDKPGKKVILALDVEKERALTLASEVSNLIEVGKVGLELFCEGGKEIVEEIHRNGLEIFLDLKFHDIPRQVERTLRSLSHLPIKMLTLHTLGGEEMLKSAVKAAKDSFSKPLLLGVTILTSLDESSLKPFFKGSIREIVLRLTELALNCGLDGVVASPLEVELLRSKLGKDFLIVTPGVRFKREEGGDQKRVSHPREALLKGANYVVVGREVTKSANPVGTLEELLSELR
ncbi:MAG: orotidine-5'-phosphate decarboxylase [Candidatus Bathyarchaeia archaeon]